MTEDGKLVEMHVERAERVVGSLYKCRVANVLPGMDASFVDVGLERAFHYVPGKPSERTEIPSALMEREVADRMHLLEQLADHDDALAHTGTTEAAHT